ncbi:gem-associated protein 6 [Suncus etruscus]|uniref:gem-associated protein 6 n=1 Tax=Suncus etruscus TaxID=109475 RepID=UPI00210FF512|nr:gem-associated protein 6 [Suncus etruscus]
MGEWADRGPLQWQEWTRRAVRVSAGGREYRGWVLTTDPVSASIVLVTFLEDGSLSVTGIMGHAVRSVTADTEAELDGDGREQETLARLFESPDFSEAYSPELLEKRKGSLKTWLEKNHVPVAELGDAPSRLCVAGALTVEPPYRPEDCSCANEIILSRIQDLIRRSWQPPGEADQELCADLSAPGKP